METGAVVAVTVQTMEGGDTASLPNTLDEAQRQLAEIEVEPREVVADKGYHQTAGCGATSPEVPMTRELLAGIRAPLTGGLRRVHVRGREEIRKR